MSSKNAEESNHNESGEPAPTLNMIFNVNKSKCLAKY